MALSSFLSNPPLPSTILTPPGILSLLLVAFLVYTIYTLYLHPLASIPGPILARLSPLWTYIHSYLGDECSLITAAHTSHQSPVIRIAPNEICISDGSALSAIYSEKGGFAKADFYHNFDIDGFGSLFSETDRGARQPKAKSVVGLFSTSSLREGEGVLRECVGRFVKRLERERERCRDDGGSANVLDLSRSLAVDAVSAYLFRTSYGGLEEEGGHGLSASEFVNAFVGVGRFFYLPTWIFAQLERVSGWLFETEETKESMSKVDAFVRSIVEAANQEDGTYPARMLKAGLSKEETAAQCKDLMFAGTDSSGMNLSTLCWQLARNSDIHTKLRDEVLVAKKQNPSYDPASLPYLRACIREALRLSMANPTRLPRVVPLGGWTFHCKLNDKTYHFPAGTLVSCQIHTLHHNPDVFADPYKFDPERWIETDDYAPSAEMLRDLIPFSLGSRQCIARNLAMTELTLAASAIAESGVLEGAKPVGDKIEILEWFNSKVVGERIAISW